MAKEHNHIAEKCRADFKVDVKRTLAAAAGNRCSMPRCLQEVSFAVNAKRKGIITAEKRPGGIGVAAHIYGASKTNCPRPSEHDDAALSHISNGIWCCSDCGRLIDEHEKAFSAEALIAYKYVRETANSIASMSPVIRNLLPSITHFEYEEIVWKYYPALEDHIPEIEADVRNAESIKKFHKPFFLPAVLSESIISAPFVKSELTVATDALMSHFVQFAKSKPKTGDEKTIEFVAKTWYPDWSFEPNVRSTISLNEFYGAISAMCPKTGELAIERVKVFGYGVVAVDAGDSTDSVTRYGLGCWLRGYDELPIAWTLNYNLKGNVSELRTQAQRLSSPYWTDSVIENLKQYENLMRKLVDGWVPVGLLGYWTSFKCDMFNDDYFPITTLPSVLHLQEMYRRAKRTNFLIKMCSVYQLSIRITEAALSVDLEDEAIEEAFLNLKNVSENGIPFRYLSEPCAEGEGWEIRLVFESGLNWFALHFKKIIVK